MTGSVTPQGGGGGGVPSTPSDGGQMTGPHGKGADHTQLGVNLEAALQGTQGTKTSKTKKKEDTKSIKDKAVKYSEDESQTQNLQSKKTLQNNLNSVTPNKPNLDTFDSKGSPKHVSEKTMDSLKELFSGPTEKKSASTDPLSFLPSEAEDTDAPSQPAGQTSSSTSASSWLGGNSMIVATSKAIQESQREQRDFASASLEQIAQDQNTSWSTSVTAKDKSISAAKSDMWAQEMSGLATTVAGGLEVAGAASSMYQEKAINSESEPGIKTATEEVEKTDEALTKANDELGEANNRKKNLEGAQKELDDLEKNPPTDKEAITTATEKRDKAQQEYDKGVKVDDAQNRAKKAKEENNSAKSALASLESSREAKINTKAQRTMGLMRAMSSITEGAGKIFSAPLSMQAATEKAQAGLDQASAQVSLQTAQVLAKALESSLQLSASLGQTMLSVSKAGRSGYN